MAQNASTGINSEKENYFENILTVFPLAFSGQFHEFKIHLPVISG